MAAFKELRLLDACGPAGSQFIELAIRQRARRDQRKRQGTRYYCPHVLFPHDARPGEFANITIVPLNLCAVPDQMSLMVYSHP